MREILFRGQRIDNGEWIEGTLYQISTDLPPFIMLVNSNAESHEVDPETVGQYTGLTDKNGKKIFEGDIVKLYLIDGVEVGVIKFNDIMCRFMFFPKYGGYSFDKGCKLEVIGNIHDNPELLKGETDENSNIKHNGDRYTAIKELDQKLTELGIPHEMHELYDGYQVCVSEECEPHCFDGDAIQHFGSCGSERNLLEVYGFNLNEPEGHLTVEQALEYFVKWNADRKDG